MDKKISQLLNTATQKQADAWESIASNKKDIFRLVAAAQNSPPPKDHDTALCVRCVFLVAAELLHREAMDHIKKEDRTWNKSAPPSSQN